MWPNIPQLKLGNIQEYSPKTARVAKKIWRITNTIASIWGENRFGYLSLDIICSEKRTVFRERSSRKTVSFSEQIMSKDKYPSIFSRQMEAIVYINLFHWVPKKNDGCYWDGLGAAGVVEEKCVRIVKSILISIFGINIYALARVAPYSYDCTHA